METEFMIAGAGIYRQVSDMLRDSYWMASKYVSTWHYFMRQIISGFRILYSGGKDSVSIAIIKLGRDTCNTCRHRFLHASKSCPQVGIILALSAEPGLSPHPN